ncbi:60s acidic ribosomal protein-domain-containing protein [Cokeromyces recurvatus]|uniref:60s acidic ribosomal protein-domain-containing protein n=1 Tax=Cokeromyces recurvatus TaxID=90255 RepID=UPI00221ED9A7|nr:60s acidic ribosomal protein-domain-containing protein [Cokeromyces recurvatus]KAI7900685.1 60s acidic ribosomal protein-domain-containing protein [Cokeromyces recurvatus]
MKHLAAYLLLVAGGNATPSNDDIKKVLSSVGVEVDESRLSALLKAMEGKTAAEAIAEGSSKLASVSAGPVAAAGAGAAGAAASGEAAAEEEKAEEKEESDEDMGFGLFD